MGTFLMHMGRSLQIHISKIFLSQRQKEIKRVVYLTMIHDNGTIHPLQNPEHLTVY